MKSLGLQGKYNLKGLIVLVAWIGVGLINLNVQAQLDETWTVTVNGQTVQVNPDGSFRIPNVSAPDQFGLGGPGTRPDFLSDDFIRAIGTSTVNGVTRYAFSEPFQFRNRQTFIIGEMTITDNPPPLPTKILLTADESLIPIGNTTQLTVTGTLPDGSAADLTQRSFWTVYRTSNPAVATVGENGLVTGNSAGNVFITAVNEGATSVKLLTVTADIVDTTVQGFVQFEDGTPASGATVTTSFSGDELTGAEGFFSFPINTPSEDNTVAVRASTTVDGERLVGTSGPVEIVPDGLTDAGVITLRPRMDVLILADVDGVGTAALGAALEAAGFGVTTRPAPEFTWDGTNPTLDDFGVVIHLNGATSSVSLPLSAQTTLVDFVRNGGGFIGWQWNGFELVQGQQLSMSDLILQTWNTVGSENCGGCAITYSIVPEQQGHPVLDGIPNAFTFTADAHDAGTLRNFAVDPPTVLMTSPSGNPAVTVREFEAGRVVNFSAAPNFSGQVTLQDSNIQQLVINAADWSTNSVERTSVIVAQVPSVTTVTGRIVDSQGNGIDGATLSIDGTTIGQSSLVGNFSVNSFQTNEGDKIVVTASGMVDGQPCFGGSGTIKIVAGGTTNIGNIVIDRAYPLRE